MFLIPTSARRSAAAATLFLVAGLVHAQARSGSRPEASDPQAQVPAARYVSPLRGYQAFNETPLTPWRESNERVRQRGGWKAYAREALEPASPAASAPALMPAPAHRHTNERGTP